MAILGLYGSGSADPPSSSLSPGPPAQTARKILVFTNRRHDVETLSALAARIGRFGERVFAHHGSLSRDERERVEERFLHAPSGVCFATMTLELGIDIGDVDLVVLVEPPASVSAFLQRVGRGNRRTEKARVLACCRNRGDLARFQHLLEEARRGCLLEPPYVFRPSVVGQQACSLLMQSRSGTISTSAIRERLPAAIGASFDEETLQDLLARLEKGGWVVPARFGRVAPGPKLMMGHRRGTMHANLPAESDGLDVVDEDTGRVLGQVRAAGPSTTIALAGRSRRVLREAEGLEHETTRRAAQLEGDVEAAEARRAERESVAESLAEELTEVRSALEESRSQGDLFTDQVAACKEKMEEGRRRVHGLEAEVSESREAFERLRGDELTAQDRAGQLAARRSALERMEEDREGLDPAVQAVLEDEVEGVEGILADFLEPEPEVSSAVEAYLGVHLRALVVRDSGVAERLREWFGDTWDGGGGMLLLPLDRVSVAEAPGELLARVEVRGAGAPWVSALLDGVELSDAWGNGPESAGRLELDRVGRGGEWVERSGVVGVGNPFGAMDLLERRERLRSLGEEADRAEAEWASLRDRREAAQGELVELERTLDEARSSLREAEEGWRRAQAEEGERSERRARLERAIDELEARLVSTRADVKTSSARAEEAHKERQGLLERQGEVSERGAAARRRLDDVRETWEEIRDEGSRLAVERSRLEGEVVRAGERMEDIKRDRSATRERLDALSREEEELEDELERVRVQREEGGVALEQLFELRDAVGEELGKADESAGELHERLTEAESGVRAARAEEREMSEGRHALELEASELEGKMARMRDRLEGEWARSFDQLVEEAEPVEEGSEDQLETEIRELAVTLDRLGPVNMLAVEEHQEESARLEFLVGQRDDLVRARDDLEKAIQEINRTATRLFLECFEAIRENFRDTFRRLFEGGECDLRLTDPDDPLESTIEIQAAPGGKRAQRIDLLSGGERALTALSLLFGIYLVKPSPFCVLDEVDAPLDESNIDRFIRLLQEFKDRSQFVVITHNPRTIEAADWIYGVTMEEPGVSSIVGVRLDEALETAGA